MEEVNLVEFIDVKGWKSIGNKLCGKEFVKAKLLPPPPPNEDPQPTPPSEDDGAGNDVPAPEADNSLKEIPDEAVPKLPSKDKADNRDSFTSGDQISLL